MDKMDESAGHNFLLFSLLVYFNEKTAIVVAVTFDNGYMDQ